MKNLVKLITYLILCLNFIGYNAYSQNIQNSSPNEWQKLLDKEQFDRIINTANAILQIDYNNQDALFYLALAYQQSENQELAIPLFKNLVNQHQLHINHISHYRLALCYFYLNENQQAIKLLNQVLAQKNPPSDAQVTIAYALAKNQQLEESAKVFDQLIATQENYSLYYNRALVNWELKNLKATEQDLLKVLALNPDFKLPYFDLISVYVMQSNPTSAYKWLEELLQKRDVNLARLQQDPILTEFIATKQYQDLLEKYNMRDEKH